MAATSQGGHELKEVHWPLGFDSFAVLRNNVNDMYVSWCPVTHWLI